MREGLFEEGAVGHNGAREVGQVLPSEKRQGKSAQFLRKGDTTNTRIDVSGKKCRIVLEIVSNGNGKDASYSTDSIGNHHGSRDTSCHEIADEEVRQAYRGYERYERIVEVHAE